MTLFKLTSFHLGLCLGSLALLSAAGCSRKDDSDDATASEASSSGTEGVSTTGSVVPTDGTATTTTGETTAGSMTIGTDSGTPTTTSDTTVTTAEPACDDMEGQPNNATCTDASGCGCESGKCFIVPALGGFCGECLGDADCVATGGGCTVPNPIASVGSTCNMGEAGAGCETNEICATPEAGFCGLLLTVPGIIDVATCGACAINADCADPAAANCSPTYDVMNFSGQYVCVADASVPQNGGCNLAKDAMDLPVGNAACESGFCGEANVMGLVKLGICGECNSNADCVKIGKVKCTTPEVDLQGATLLGSICE
ncbi:MAG: hypothetical protein H0T76_13635 [Nannocystis sp.]|nr:hypothetical protein [Nannocystis sp.]MBA3547520.1 hypothetical protein [Nannocystis sp.]